MMAPARYVFSLLLVAAGSSPALGQGPGEPGARPNILLIVADDMGYGDLSCYGSLQIQTPNLDRLAASGVRCTDGYVSGCVCAPSRAGLLTGRYGSRFGFEHNLSRPDYLQPEFAGIPLDEPLISDRLKALGYRTGLVGKWHAGESVDGHHPNARGFDEFFGMLNGHHDYFPAPEKNRLLRNRENVTEIRTPYLTDWFTLEAMDFIRRGEPATTPWFLYLAYNTPHSPMQAKESDLAAYAHIQPKARQAYCAMQRSMDENIGRLLALLEERGESENTLIVFISDNGGSVEVSHAVNAPLRGTKGTFLEGGIRVPTIFRWPARLAPRVYEQPVISLDFMATFVTAAGGTPPRAGVRTERAGRNEKNGPIYDSLDLVPYFRGEKEGEPHELLFWRTSQRGKAVRKGRWKLVEPNSQLPQLYDLSADISETVNLIHEHPAVAQELLADRLAWELTCERSPMFMSGAYWSGYNARLYAKEYALAQPAPDNTKNLWTLPPAVK